MGGDLTWSMARTGRPKEQLVLSEAERADLERLARRARTNRHLAMRAKLILRCAEGLPSVVVAKKVRVSNATVGKGAGQNKLVKSTSS